MKTMKNLSLYLLCAIVLAGIRVYAQPGPPKCGGVVEPPIADICGIGGPDSTCIYGPPPCGGNKYGRNYEYCCHETLTTCIEVQGRWKCCNYGSYEAWTPECKLLTNTGNACDSAWEHCL